MTDKRQAWRFGFGDRDRCGLWSDSRLLRHPENSMTSGSNRPPGMSRGLTLLFAIAGGAAVSNLYWAQPLLAEIAASLGVPVGAAGLLVTVTQVGYAIGILLIVPLGDTLNRRRLIPAVMGCSALALMACAFAPTFAVLLMSLAAVGVMTVTGQLLNPLAGDLAHDSQRGRVIGTVGSGLITGILFSRAISGIFADAFGWRALYVAAAVMTATMAILLARALPPEQPRPAVSYASLLWSVFGSVRRHRIVQVMLVFGGVSFAVFTMFWTGLTLLLSAPPFSYSVSQIGLVGLMGVTGALAAPHIGWLHDRGWSVGATGAALVLALLSLGVAVLGTTSIVPILVAVFMLDIAIQTLNVLNRARLFAVDPKARSRLNTAFVANNFVWGAAGSSLAGILWGLGRWHALMLGGAVLFAFALIVWLTQRRALASFHRGG
jgi:predicted MFS family arabinose efflux permease